MTASHIAQEKILGRIEKRFSKYRENNHDKRIRYPEKLKALVRSGLVLGVAAEKIAKAAGVSGMSISNWTNSSERVEPRELRVADTQEICTGSLGESGLARIRLCSGALIEIPTTALTAEFLRRLTGGEQ